MSKKRMGLRTTFVIQPGNQKKLNLRDIQQRRAEGHAGRERGHVAERRFLEAWSDVSLYPSWLASVRKATAKEDNKQKTDAVMITVTGRAIRIQVKCYSVSEIGRERFHRENVVPLSVLLEDELEMVRKHTLEMIREFEQKTRRFLTS